MPTVTSQNKLSFIKDLWNKFTDDEAPAVPAAPVRASDRWKSVPYGALQITKTDYSTGQPESQSVTYDTDAAIRQWGKTGKSSPALKETIDPSLFHAIYDATKVNPKFKMTPEDVVTLLMQEGRGDLGANAKDVTQGWKHNPRSAEIFDTLKGKGYNDYDAGTAALLYDKQETADRLSRRYNKPVPWQAVWNGMGVTKTGRTGYDYAREFQMNRKNISANQAALEMIRRHMSEPQ